MIEPSVVVCEDRVLSFDQNKAACTVGNIEGVIGPIVVCDQVLLSVRKESHVVSGQRAMPSNHGSDEPSRERLPVRIVFCRWSKIKPTRQVQNKAALPVGSVDSESNHRAMRATVAHLKPI